jgi:hypothetical protein
MANELQTGAKGTMYTCAISTRSGLLIHSAFRGANAHGVFILWIIDKRTHRVGVTSRSRMVNESVIPVSITVVKLSNRGAGHSLFLFILIKAWASTRMSPIRGIAPGSYVMGRLHPRF